MKSTCIAPLYLDGCATDNWAFDAQPVAILNEASTLHERVAYCHGLASAMQQLAELLYDSNSEGVARAAGRFFSRLVPLVTMLERMGADTCLTEHKAGRGRCHCRCQIIMSHLSKIEMAH